MMVLSGIASVLCVLSRHDVLSGVATVLHVWSRHDDVVRCGDCFMCVEYP